MVENIPLNVTLFERFPNLEEKYLVELKYNDYEEPHSHNIYESVLVPYLKDCINMTNNAEMEKIFSFIEKILKEDNSYKSEVIIFSVIEPLVSEYCQSEEIINKMIHISGSKTKIIFEQFFERYVRYNGYESISNLD